MMVQAFARLAGQAGVDIDIDPSRKVAGQITLANGRKLFFWQTTLELNPAGATEIARDKDAANYFMRRMGYPVIPGRAFYSEGLAASLESDRDMRAGWRYARTLGLPVVVKPNRGRQGFGVAKVYTRDEYDRAATFIFAKDNVMLVQRPVSGIDCRILVLDETILSAYERTPLTVRGDGRSTIMDLLEVRRREMAAGGRTMTVDHRDFRILAKLRRQRLRLSSIPRQNQEVELLDNANLSAGGAAVDVADTVHPEFKQLAIRLTRDMGLRYCGVDLMLRGRLSERPRKYWVIEINGAPGLDHFAAKGRKRKAYFDGLYLEILRALKRGARSAR
jgi:D-alanine-D-alanine ligase-like ATP-grasp enzyme